MSLHGRACPKNVVGIPEGVNRRPRAATNLLLLLYGKLLSLNQPMVGVVGYKVHTYTQQLVPTERGVFVICHPMLHAARTPYTHAFAFSSYVCIGVYLSYSLVAWGPGCSMCRCDRVQKEKAAGE